MHWEAMNRTNDKNRRRVLVIDPDADSQRAYVGYFRGTMFDLSGCEGVTEALERLGRERYDCILMDVLLPEMRGYEAVRFIQKKEPDTPIILTAAENSKTLESRVRQESIFYYYIKSFNSDELRMAVESATRKIRPSNPME